MAQGTWRETVPDHSLRSISFTKFTTERSVWRAKLLLRFEEENAAEMSMETKNCFLNLLAAVIREYIRDDSGITLQPYRDVAPSIAQDRILQSDRRKCLEQV